MTKEGGNVNVCGGLFMAIVIGVGWFGWSIWVRHSDKTLLTIFGLIALGLLLLGLIIFFAKELVAVIFVVVALPFLFIYFSGRLCLFLLSPICVISMRPGWKSASRGNYCRLCEKCDSIIDRSNLLLGSPWILVQPVEMHTFYNQPELETSAKGCHLCRLLLNSVEVFNSQGSSSTQEPPKETIEETKSNPTGEEVVSQANDCVFKQDTITLKIWRRLYLLKSPVLRIQLLGAAVAQSKSLEVEWKLKSESR
jgi:hypothetical protein